MVRRNFNVKVVFESSKATLRTTSMVMILVLFGNLFSATFLFVGGGDVIIDLLIGGELHPTIILFIMLFAIFLLGMFIDWVAILLVCLPVFMPICLELGFNPLWFSMLICIVLQTSFLTPPFGYALFYFAGAAPTGKCQMMDIYKGVLPFIALQAIGVFICILFPSIITYIPRIIFK
jgi:TRAP-type mannitol/chloroaromatic compound transport system permease large subunit